MIESCYWKEDLLEHARELKPDKKPKRWTEKRHVNFEKKISISFFIIRKLLESNKLPPTAKAILLKFLEQDVSQAA